MAVQFLTKLLFSYYVRIFPFSPEPSMSSQIYLCRSHDNSVSKLFQEGKGGTLCDEVTHQKAISQKVSHNYYVRLFPFSPWDPKGPKYHFADSTKRVLANCFRKSKLYVCVMNSQIRKQFLRKHLSRFERMKFPLSAEASMRFKKSLFRFLKDSVNGLLHET